MFSAFASKARAITVPLPPKDVEKYLRKAAPALERLEKLRPLLASIDALQHVDGETLRKAAAELDATGRALSAIEPPRKVSETHELLAKACALGATAARAAAETAPENTQAWSAASAAAGALMLIERARADLGVTSKIGP